MRLQGKVALITGASQGIGAAIAERFVREGARVALCARRPGPLEALAERLRALGGSVTTAAFDVAEHERLTRFVEEVASAQGTLDILVNNAPSVTYAPIAQMEVEAFRRDFRVNVDAAFAATRAAHKLMSARRSGSIINIASVSRSPRACEPVRVRRRQSRPHPVHPSDRDRGRPAQRARQRHRTGRDQYPGHGGRLLRPERRLGPPDRRTRPAAAFR